MRTIPALEERLKPIGIILIFTMASTISIYALIETIMKPKDIKIYHIMGLIMFPVHLFYPCIPICIYQIIINEYRVLRSYFQTKNDTINNNTVKRKNRSMYEYLGDKILTDIIIHGSV